LNFYDDSVTTSRRSAPIPQSVCRGTPCKYYTPDVVHCVSLPGGFGTEVDWKCEADLPDSLRFGRVEVSCEGWSGPGDPFVLKGSCSLEYRLVEVPSALRPGATDFPGLSKFQSIDFASIIFYALWFAVLAFIVYQFLKSCLGRDRATPNGPRRDQPRPYTGGSFPGGSDHYHDPPPPYQKNNNQGADGTWRPGFWTGAAVGGLANHLWNRRQADPVQTRPRHTAYDWEQDRVPRSSLFGARGPTTTPRRETQDRGEGTSNLGTMRRSTGFGGSQVR